MQRFEVFLLESDRVGVAGRRDPGELAFDPFCGFRFRRHDADAAGVFNEGSLETVHQPRPAIALGGAGAEVVAVIVEVEASLAETPVRAAVEIDLQAAVEHIEQLLLGLF